MKKSSRIRRLLWVCAALGAIAAIATPALAGTGGTRAERAHAAKAHRHKHKTHRRRHHKKRVKRPCPSCAQSVAGDIRGGVPPLPGAVPAYHFQFNASRPAGAPESAATGTFSEQQFDANGTLVESFTATVACLDVVGHQMSLFYKVKSNNAATLGGTSTGGYFYANVTPKGKPKFAGLAPQPNQEFSSCPATTGTIPITSGTLRITGG